MKSVCVKGVKAVPNLPPAKQPEKSQADITDKTCLLPYGSIFQQQQ